ncbi:peroxisome proliferator-activated receptor gamma coactivator 1-alpha-like protein [Willisornis vidua]|uniref:Peroxisome proliferator-activated receptor gamma coactivator 1-alpha-like protein n=1 Tax=Willisornis vidua TaxID=1566151 RepID=A0ABQ9DMB3_9PASS|nr:peroxisome proliferator-activated receptor gamma coactivator 1-alpha-like protein [Willisornis vidua]
MAWDMCNQDSVWSDLECAALVGEDQPLCPDLPELDLSELDVNDLDADSFLGGLKWYSDQSEIISNQYSNEPANIFELDTLQYFFTLLLCNVTTGGAQDQKKMSSSSRDYLT